MTKNRKIQLAIAIVILVLTTSFISQQTNSGFVTVRTLEVGNGIWDSKICIIYEDGKVEEIALEKFRDRTFSPNTKKINETINSLIAKGYTLSFSSSGNGDGVLTNMFLFKK